jgi:CHAD domain-containing protein
MAESAKPANAYPVQALQEQATNLEAALELTLARPRKRPVHQLRTTTRRIEALLELLDLLEPFHPALAGFSARAAKLKRLLAAVRKAAGKVRDLDVQRDLIRQAAHEPTQKHLRGDAKQLRRTLKAQREREAQALLDELEHHALKLGPKLEKLIAQLEPAKGVAVSPARLASLAHNWYAPRWAGAQGPETSEETLHAVRKAAKLARYMAEAGTGNARANSAAESSAAARMAEHFEQTQQLGGDWHDALTLRRVAEHQLGRKADLARVFGAHEQAALTHIRKHLQQQAVGTN